MYITSETDYAVRIVDALARNEGRMDAKAIADKACVTLRFSLKILRKLVASGIIRSFKGSLGGYEIARPLHEITIFDVINIIEGPIVINRCLLERHGCTRLPDKKCPYHDMFEQITSHIHAQLASVSFEDVISLSN